jgi:hypothetical protein
LVRLGRVLAPPQHEVDAVFNLLLVDASVELDVVLRLLLADADVFVGEAVAELDCSFELGEAVAFLREQLGLTCEGFDETK